MRDSNRRRARIDEVLDQVGLGKVAHRKVKKLSGGMVRRLGVAQALVHEPQVLVVDEPTVGLDPEERIRFRQLMTQLGRERTILLSTHIVADLGAGCREIALLDSGRTVFQGSPSELIRRALGRVFEVTVAPAEAEAIEGRYEIVSTSVSSDNVTLRGVTAGEQLPASATAVAEPNLEESYLAFMATRDPHPRARATVVPPAPPLSRALHPDQRLLVEHGRAFLPRPDGQALAPRRVPQRAGRHRRDRRVHRSAQRRPQARSFGRRRRRTSSPRSPAQGEH